MPELVKFWLELDKVPPELGEVLAELKHLFDILASFIAVRAHTSIMEGFKKSGPMRTKHIVLGYI